MTLRRLSSLAFVYAVLTYVTGVCDAADRPDASVADLITRAGNADEDAVRLEILRKLQNAPAVDAKLKADVDNMVAAVDRWVNSSSLTYFSREVSRTTDFDFKISPDSPLYPLTCLYRARMLQKVLCTSITGFHMPTITG